VWIGYAEYANLTEVALTSEETRNQGRLAGPVRAEQGVEIAGCTVRDMPLSASTPFG
jgi:hypothetical protein